MKKLKEFVAKPDLERWKFYARGLAAIAGIVLLYALYAQYQVRRMGARTHGQTERIADLRHLLDSAAADAKYYENEYGQTYADNIALKAQNDKTLQALSASIFSLKTNQERLVTRVVYLTKVAQQARMDSVFVRYDTARIPQVSAGRSDSIGVPQRFELSDASRYLSGQVTKTGVLLERLEIPDSLYLRGGVRKKGFLNLGRENFVQAVHTSPYIQTTGLAEMRLTVKPKRWGIGPYVGYGWDGVRFAPNGGISLQYSLIRF